MVEGAADDTIGSVTDLFDVLKLILDEESRSYQMGSEMNEKRLLTCTLELDLASKLLAGVSKWPFDLRVLSLRGFFPRCVEFGSCVLALRSLTIARLLVTLT